jgi:hypothetical protein
MASFSSCHGDARTLECGPGRAASWTQMWITPRPSPPVPQTALYVDPGLAEGLPHIGKRTRGCPPPTGSDRSPFLAPPSDGPYGIRRPERTVKSALDRSSPLSDPTDGRTNERKCPFRIRQNRDGSARGTRGSLFGRPRQSACGAPALQRAQWRYHLSMAQAQIALAPGPFSAVEGAELLLRVLADQIGSERRRGAVARSERGRDETRSWYGAYRSIRAHSTS